MLSQSQHEYRAERTGLTGATACGTLAAGLAIAALIGWIYDYAPLAGLRPSFLHMRPNTALCILLAGVALVLSAPAPDDSLRRRIGRWLAWSVIVIATLTFAETLFNIDIGIARILFDENKFPDPLMGGPRVFPLQMGLVPAAGLILVAIGILQINRRVRGRWSVAQLLALFGGSIGLVGLLGHLYGVDSLHRYWYWTAIAAHTAISLLLLNAGLFMARPRMRPASLLWEAEASRVLAWRLLLPGAIVTVLLGWAWIGGVEQGWFGLPHVAAIMVFLTILLLLAVVGQSLAALANLQKERRQTERELQTSEEHRRVALESAELGTWDIELSSNTVRWDARCQALFGLAHMPEVPLELPLSKMHPDDATRVQEAIRAVAEQGLGGRIDVEYRVLLPARAQRWVHATGQMVHDTVGPPDSLHLIGVVSDVSAAKAAAEQTARLAAIVAQTEDAIIRLSLDGTITDWNDAAESIYGYSAEEAHGASILIVADPARPREPLELLHRCLAGEEVVSFETTRRHKDGRIFPIAITLSPIRDEHDRITAFSAVVRDESQRRAMERQLAEERRLSERSLAQLEAIVNQMTEGLVIFDPDGNLLSMNPAGLAIHGFDNDADLRRHLHQLSDLFTIYDLNGNKLPVERWPIGRALAGEVFDSYEVRVVRTDNGRTWIGSYGGTPIRDREGRMILAAVTTRDVTQRHEIERQLVEARRKAEAANQAKSQFLANVSHELRTPMTAILGFTDILRRRVTDERDLQHLETIRRNGKFLVRLVDDILDLSKIEAGRLEVADEQVHPDHLVRDVAALMLVRAREKNLALTVEFEGQLPETIRSDAKRLRQVLVNLIGNAIKFTERGGVRVMTRLLPDERIEFAVRDTGIGVPPDQRDRIFEIFSQGDTSITSRFGGSGLGLAISKRLVEMLGGGIDYESEPGRGSTFRFTVGTGSLTGVRMIEPAAVLETPGVPVEAVRLTCNVLVVEDQPDVRNLLRYELQEAGAHVWTAEHGGLVLEALREAEASNNSIDVIVMDMQMPVVDGYTAAADLRRQGFEQPIIALTAYAMQGDRERCLAVGCNEYLAKPVEAQQLVRAIVEHSHCRIHDNEQPEDLPPSSTEQTGAVPTPTDQRKEASVDRGMRILIAEDNLDLAESLQMLLELHGHAVSIAGSGEDALASARETRPEVVVLDLGLPDKPGDVVAEEMRQDPDLSGVKLIALTGRDLSGSDRRRFFDHVLLKPADADDIQRLLAS